MGVIYMCFFLPVARLTVIISTVHTKIAGSVVPMPNGIPKLFHIMQVAKPPIIADVAPSFVRPSQKSAVKTGIPTDEE